MSVHFTITEIAGAELSFSQWDCLECGETSHDVKEGVVMQTPVDWCLQTMACPACGATNFYLNAGSKSDCVALEPVLAEMAAEYRGLAALWAWTER